MSKPPINPKHVLILGAGPGLSAAVEQRFGREGFEVTLLARSGRNLTEVAERLRAENVTWNTVPGDAADTQLFRKPWESIPAEATPGVVIYNACVSAPADLLSV